MNKDSLINEEINSDRTDLTRTFKEIREVLKKAQSREDLTELYKQSVYMILMTHSTPLDEKDSEMKRRRETTEQEFAKTVRMVNERAKQIGVEADYDDDWEKLSTNGYKTEGENLQSESNAGMSAE